MCGVLLERVISSASWFCALVGVQLDRGTIYRDNAASILQGESQYQSLS